MNTKTKCEGTFPRRLNYRKCGIAGWGALLFLLPLAAPGEGVVTNCTEANLRAALVGGGTVTFACDGTITLGSTITNDTDTVVDGTGHQVTISGGNAVRVFQVNTNVTFTLATITLTNTTQLYFDTSTIGQPPRLYRLVPVP